MRRSILFCGAALALSACTDAVQDGTDTGNGATAPSFDVEVHDGELRGVAISESRGRNSGCNGGGKCETFHDQYPYLGLCPGDLPL